MSYRNVFVCYTVQNYLKALYLSYLQHQLGERSKILALFYAGTADPGLLQSAEVFWADVEHMPHRNAYVRILQRDPAWLRARKAAHKGLLSLSRLLLKAGERKRLLASLAQAERVFLFLENTYFSAFILKHRVCTLVEEGLTTYKAYRPASWQQPRYPGEHRNVSEVLLQHPQLAAESIRHKTRRLDLDYGGLPADVRRVLLRVFGLEDFTRQPHTAIIVGQAWARSSVDGQSVARLYRKIGAVLRSQGFDLVFKPHPSEDPSDYADLDCRLINPRIPLEVFDLRDDGSSFDHAVSILAGSLGDARRLARRKTCFVQSDLVVEAVPQALIDELEQSAEATLREQLVDLGAAEASAQRVAQPIP